MPISFVSKLIDRESVEAKAYTASRMEGRQGKVQWESALSFTSSAWLGKSFELSESMAVDAKGRSGTIITWTRGSSTETR